MSVKTHGITMVAVSLTHSTSHYLRTIIRAALNWSLSEQQLDCERQPRELLVRASGKDKGKVRKGYFLIKVQNLLHVSSKSNYFI